MLDRLIKYLGIDSAIIFTLINNIFRVIFGLVSIYIITSFFSQEQQGYYYTFLSILALQSFVELGLTLVIMNIASHEWAYLHLNEHGDIVGNKDNVSRLKSLATFTLRWFGIAGFLFTVIVTICGYTFFAQNHNFSNDWVAPWIIVSIFSGLIIPLLPFIAFLEGCNQVINISKFRLLQSSLMSVTFLVVALFDGGLWALVASIFINLITACWFLFVRYYRFFGSLFSSNDSSLIDWRFDIWPLQWKIGLSGIFSYFAMSLFVPVMFVYHGPVIAGQMGVTISIASAIQSIGLSWISTRIPLFGGCIAKKEFDILDKLWLKTSLVSTAFVFIAFLLLIFVLLALSSTENILNQRLLPLSSSIYYFIAIMLMQITQCESIYLRAHKREPLFVVGVISSSIIGISVWKFGELYGPIGATLSYLMVVTFCILPWITYIWYSAYSNWRHEF